MASGLTTNWLCLTKGCWVGQKPPGLSGLRQCRFFWSQQLELFLFAKNLQSLELQLDSLRKVAFRPDRKHCFFFQADLPGESTDFGLEAWVLGLCLDAGAGCSRCWLLQKVAAIFHAGLWGRQKVLSCFCFWMLKWPPPPLMRSFSKERSLCYVDSTSNPHCRITITYVICAMVWIPVLSLW